jgi:hypothetical protein
LAGTEVLPIVQSTTTKQVSVANLTAGRAVATLNLSTSGATSTTPVLGFNATNCNIASGATVANTYLQAVMQNKSGTAGASTNWALSNDLGTDSTYYGEFGMNSSVFSASTPADYFSINNGIYFSGHDGDVSIGSGNGFKTYLAWGTTGQSAHVINATGALGLSTNLGTTPANSGTTGFGTAKNVLVSQGSGAAPVWSTSTDILVNTLTIGLGNGSVATNTAIGYQAINATATGANNVGVGYQSLKSLTSGVYNIAIGGNDSGGFATLLYNTTGTYNIAIGSGALGKTGTSNGSIAIGVQALNSSARVADANAYNVGVGHQACYATTTGQFITAIGNSAGYAGSANANTTGSNNTYIGASAVGSAVSNTNEMVIGYAAIGLGSNSTVIGNSSTTQTKVFGSLTSTGVMFTQQATTAAAPAYVKGGIYFDTTLNKLRVGGATAWETITSV